MKRFLALALSFVMVLSMLPVEALAAAPTSTTYQLVGEDEWSESLHFIVRHWHAIDDATKEPFADRTVNSTVIEGYIRPNGVNNYELYLPTTVGGSKPDFKLATSSYGSGVFKDYIQSFNNTTGELVLKVNPVMNDADNALEKFTGFSLSAGQTAIQTNESGNTSTMTISITNPGNVHLAKAHVFYVKARRTVEGTDDEAVFGSKAILGASAEIDTAKVYIYTQNGSGHKKGDVVKDGNGQPIYQSANGTPPGGNTMPAKVYSTTAGLHTDKTASELDQNDSRLSGMTDYEKGRTFNVDLEAWYNSGDPVAIAMVLDASGSMGFTTKNPTPIRLSQSQIASLNIKPLTTANQNDAWSSFFLNDTQIKEVLNSKYTDNSRLGVSDYTYFVYDGRKTTLEFGPLAYWGGTRGNGGTALDKSGGTVLGTINSTNYPNNKPGWYFINPTANWSDNYFNSNVQSGKTLHGIQNMGNNKLQDSVNVPESLEQPTTHSNTSKQYDTQTDGYGIPIQFYVDDQGYLRCFFTTTNTEEMAKAACSYVYVNEDADYIKSEALQRALGLFVNMLYEASPDSYVAATRFSTDNQKVLDQKDLDKFVLLDWTNDPAESSAVLSLQRGASSGNKGGTTNGDTSDNNIVQYNYGLTGGTSTWRGLKAFNDNLLNTNKNPDNPGIDPAARKYLIIFTDGLDTDVRDSKARNIPNSTGTNSLTDSDALYAVNEYFKKKDYTVFTVMLAGGPVVEGTYQYDEQAKPFLKSLAGTKTSKPTDPNIDGHYFLTTAGIPAGVDPSDELTKAFTKTILGDIIDALEGYAMKDYIDPRFDLVDADGVLWKLGPGGAVTVGNRKSEKLPANGKKIHLSTDGSVDADAQSATLYYDGKNDMYYLNWTNQTIPVGTIGAKTVSVWSARLTVRAKEDFIGGNAVLTNGQQSGMNLVYHPSAPNKSSGIDDLYRKIDNPAANDDYVSKGFPRVTVNVETPSIEGPEESLIYMGEPVVRGIFENAVSSLDGPEKWYWDYILRYTKAHPQDGDQIENLVANGKVEIPYYYLQRLDGSNQSGVSGQQDSDPLGVMIYIWKDDSSSDNSSPTEDTTPREGRLTVVYMPYNIEDTDDLPEVDDLTDTSLSQEELDAIAKHARDKARLDLNNALIKEGVYKWNRWYKEEVGDSAWKDGLYEYSVKIVSGEIILRVKLTREDVEFLKSAFPGGTFSYKADLKRTYDPGTVTKARAAAINNVTVGTFTLSKAVDELPAGEDEVILWTTITYDQNNYKYSDEYALPIGTYSVAGYPSSNTALYTFTNPVVIPLDVAYMDEFTQFGKQLGEHDGKDGNIGEKIPDKLWDMRAPFDNNQLSYLGTGVRLDRSRVYTDERYALLEVTIQHAADAVPQTGDNSNIQMWLALMFVAIGAMVAFYPRRRAAKDRQ